MSYQVGVCFNFVGPFQNVRTLLRNKSEALFVKYMRKIIIFFENSPAAYGAEECVVERVEQIVDHQVYEVEMGAENPPGS